MSEVGDVNTNRELIADMVRDAFEDGIDVAEHWHAVRAPLKQEDRFKRWMESPARKWLLDKFWGADEPATPDDVKAPVTKTGAIFTDES